MLTPDLKDTRNGSPKKRIKPGRYGLPQIEMDGDMPALDWIHWLFLFYSAAHNCINAWRYSHGPIFFLFVVVGIISVELMLHSVYKYWKDGQLVGKMLRVAEWAGAMAMFFATAGILAQAQAGETQTEWTSMYYSWILPSSAPVMFFFSFLIQSVNPVMSAERDESAYRTLLGVEERREELDKRKIELDYRRDVRKLKVHVAKQKLAALWKESAGRRTRYTLKRAMRSEMPKLLKQIGIDTDQTGYGRPSFFGNLLPGRKSEKKS